MLVPNSRCWRLDLSPTSKSCQQHIWSPTSVTNIDVTCQYCYRVIMTYLVSPIGNPSPSTHSKLNSIVRFHGSEPAFQTGTNFSYPSFSSLIFQEFESVMWSGEIAFETAKIWFSPSLVITQDFWKSFTLSGEPRTAMRTILLAKQQWWDHFLSIIVVKEFDIMGMFSVSWSTVNNFFQIVKTS